MRKIIVLTLSIVGFTLLGCSDLERSIEKTMIATSGNNPPSSFKVANLQTMKEYVFNMKDFTIAMPTAKKKDFSLPRGWIGWTHYGKNVVLALDNDKGYGMYHIYASTSGKIRNFGEKERAIIENDVKYLQNRFPKKTRKGKIYNTNVKTIRGGKENYPCIVRESYEPKYEKRKISYGCFKIDPRGTKVKGAGVTLTYHKPKNPTLAKQYTYQDLKQRAKRMLDSLYIKDGW